MLRWEREQLPARRGKGIKFLGSCPPRSVHSSPRLQDGAKQSARLHAPDPKILWMLRLGLCHPGAPPPSCPSSTSPPQACREAK